MVADGTDYKLDFELPREGAVYPGTFCSWTIVNDATQYVHVVVMMNSVSFRQPRLIHYIIVFR